MECQICGGSITPVATHNIEVLSCEKCNGFWIKKGDLNKLIEHHGGDVEVSSVDHHVHPDSHGILKCAFCEDRATIKVNFLEQSDVILDYCEECGSFWVDKGELQKMQEYMTEVEEHAAPQTVREWILKICYSLPKV